MDQIKAVHYGSDVKVIGVVSDTHIPTRGHSLPAELFRLFEGVQLILHAGDLVDEKVIDELRALAPVEAVAGNMDPIHLKNRLGRFKLVNIGTVGIGMLHGDLRGRRISFDRVKDIFHPEQPRAIVFGHLHEPVVKEVEGVLYFNPGSLIDPRRTPRPSCGRLLINGSDISGEIIYIG